MDALDPHARAIAERILGSFPAGTYDLEALLRVTDVRLSEDVASAAITCGSRPILLLNPAFLERYCGTEERLFLLVVHEIYHLLLGHTRLYARTTPIQNVAFDAVANAILARRFPRTVFTALFADLYDPERIPDCVLGPPPGWPNAVEIPDALPDDLQRTVRALYGSSRTGITYQQLLQVLERHLGRRKVVIVGAEATDAAQGSSHGTGNGETAVDDEGAGPRAGAATVEVRLLGDHDPDGIPDGEETAGVDPLLQGALEEMVGKWPGPDRAITRRSLCGKAEEGILGRRGASGRATAELRRALGDLVLPGEGKLRSRRRVFETALVRIESPVPQLSDRRAIVARGWGEEPVLFVDPAIVRRPVRRRGLAHVYLDMSGSTKGYHGHLLEAVRPLMKRGLVRLYQFSTRVFDLDPDDLRKGRVRSTGGTSIACVARHMAEKGMTRALVVTDGWTGRPTEKDRAWLSSRGGFVTVALTPGGTRRDLERWARRFVRLPAAG